MRLGSERKFPLGKSLLNMVNNLIARVMSWDLDGGWDLGGG